MIKIILIALLGLSLASCSKTMTGKSSANATYKVKDIKAINIIFIMCFTPSLLPLHYLLLVKFSINLLYQKTHSNVLSKQQYKL